MNTLLIFFAFPLAVIIFSIILQKLLRNPVAVAAIIFAIFIVITFAAFDETFLIATLAYTIISFITAVLSSRLFHHRNNCDTDDIVESLLELLQNNNNSNNNNENDDENNDNVLNSGSSCPRYRKYRRF